MEKAVAIVSESYDLEACGRCLDVSHWNSRWYTAVESSGRFRR